MILGKETMAMGAVIMTSYPRTLSPRIGSRLGPFFLLGLDPWKDLEPHQATGFALPRDQKRDQNSISYPNSSHTPDEWFHQHNTLP